jgi:hypothetical protein
MENPDDMQLDQEDITIDFNGTLGQPLNLKDLVGSPMRASPDSF